MSKLILGIVGEMASGKDTVAAYLKNKHDAHIVNFSQMLRDILDRLYLEINRQNLVTLSEILRDSFGQEVMAKAVAHDATKIKANLICVTGVRRTFDIAELKKFENFHLINIVADQKTRYERLTKRNENSDDQTKTWEQFLLDHDQPTEITIREVAKEATITLNNNDDLETLYERTEKILKDLNAS